jgi:hypothetical protein
VRKNFIEMLYAYGIYYFSKGTECGGIIVGKIPLVFWDLYYGRNYIGSYGDLVLILMLIDCNSVILMSGILGDQLHACF